MNKISLQEAYKLLQNCSAVIVEDSVAIPSLDVLNGEDENEFLFIRWKETDFEEYSVTFMEGNNREVTVSGSDLFFVDTEGEEFQITLLAPMRVEDHLSTGKLPFKPFSW